MKKVKCVVKIKEITEEVILEQTCDICANPFIKIEGEGEVVDENTPLTNGVEIKRWKDSESKITIVYEEKLYGYEGEGETTRYSVDVCAECFVNRVMPFFRSLGATFKKEVVSY
jgi:hypothetical protein